MNITPIRCANPASLPCVWDPARCATHKLNEVEEVLGISVDRLLEGRDKPQLEHLVKGQPAGPDGWPYGTLHDRDCPACVANGAPWGADPRSEAYWAG